MNVQSNRVNLKQGEPFYLIGYRNDIYGKTEWSLLFTKVFPTREKLSVSDSTCTHLHPMMRYWEFILEDKNMQEEISTIANRITENNLPLEELKSSYTKDAIRIAEVALTSFSGELLKRALAISEAIVEFENELSKSSKEVI